MDGVLTDSEPAFHAAVNDILARYGKHISLEEYKRFIGVETPKMWAQVIELKGVPATVEQIVDEYEGPLMERLREPRPPIHGARGLLDELRLRGLPTGLCTASYARWTEAILAAAGLPDAFDAKVTGDVIEHAKPDPEPYLLAASMIGVAAQECLVVEDSVSGITSALAAGTVVVQLRATSTAAPPMSGVERVIERLEDFPMEFLLDAVSRER
jgi:HAD superfamily hydrolase (TIGR01509 family)